MATSIVQAEPVGLTGNAEVAVIHTLVALFDLDEVAYGGWFYDSPDLRRRVDFCSDRYQIVVGTGELFPDCDRERNGVVYEIGLVATAVTVGKDRCVECLQLADVYALFGPESIGFDAGQAHELANALASTTPRYPEKLLRRKFEGQFSIGSRVLTESIQQFAGPDGFDPSELTSDDRCHDCSPAQALGQADVISYKLFDPSTDMTSLSAHYVAIDSGAGCVMPSVETITNRTYPILEPVRMWVDTELDDNPQVNEFVAAVLDRKYSQEWLVPAK